MTEAVKRHLILADRKFGGAWCLPNFRGLRSITTAISMGRAGLATQHPNYGWILTRKGEEARQRLLNAAQKGEQ